MAIHRLHIDEFDEVNYDLIAIHTSLEDYHLAFYINQKFPVLLSKNKLGIPAQTNEGEAWFSRYTFEDVEDGIVWDLIQNKNEILVPKKDKSRNLFADASQEIATHIYLLPEFKKVDFFLKIENDVQDIAQMILELNTINKISTIYPVNASEIKSKNNLIF